MQPRDLSLMTTDARAQRHHGHPVDSNLTEPGDACHPLSEGAVRPGPKHAEEPVPPVPEKSTAPPEWLT